MVNGGRSAHYTLLMNNLKIIALSIFSLLPHIVELSILAADKRPHMIGIQETKQDSTVENSDINIDEYNIIRNDRNLNGGGSDTVFQTCYMLRTYMMFYMSVPPPFVFVFSKGP